MYSLLMSFIYSFIELRCYMDVVILVYYRSMSTRSRYNTPDAEMRLKDFDSPPVIDNDEKPPLGFDTKVQIFQHLK